MVYKSHFMYSFIRKDIVIAAIKWLKQNNKLYSEVEINDNWADEWLNSELSSFMNENCQDSETDNEISNPGQKEHIEGELTNQVSVQCEGEASPEQCEDSVIEECEFIEDCIAA